jgi:hypothetical protein
MADPSPLVRMEMTEPGEAAWIDVSVTIRHGMPRRPDNPPIVVARSMDIGPARAILRPIT